MGRLIIPEPGEQPLLLVVDDAHWADAPSLRFLDVFELLEETDARRGATGVIAALAGAFADQGRFERGETLLADLTDRD